MLWSHARAITQNRHQRANDLATCGETRPSFLFPTPFSLSRPLTTNKKRKIKSHFSISYSISRFPRMVLLTFQSTQKKSMSCFTSEKVSGTATDCPSVRSKNRVSGHWLVLNVGGKLISWFRASNLVREDALLFRSDITFEI